MHLAILVESDSPDSSSDSLKFDVNLAIRTTQNLKSAYSKDVAKDYLKNLDIEDVKEMASDSSPIVVDFYECMQDKRMEDFIPIQRRFYHYLMADSIEKSSKKYKYFEEILGLGDRYNEAIEAFRKFLESVSPEDEMILKKIGAIYEKFGSGTGKTFKELFALYTQYLKNPSPDIKKSILKAYWNNKSNIDDVVDEMYSISGQIFKKTNTPISKNEQQERNASILTYMQQNESELKWLSDKLLYVEYLKELFEKSGQHYSIDFNQIKEFGDRAKRPTTDSIIKSVIANHFPYNSEITKTANAIKISLHAVTHAQLTSFVEELYEHGKFTIDFEIAVKNPESKFGSPYKLLYSMQKANGVNHLYKVLNDFYNVHGSSRKVLAEMISAPEDPKIYYKKLGFKHEDGALKMNYFVHSPESFKEQMDNKIAVLEGAYNINEDEYNQFLSESLEKLSNRENPNLSLKDAMRDVDEDDLTVHSYKILAEEMKNPESKYGAYVANRVGKKVFSLIMAGKMLDKYMKNAFILCIEKNQDEILGALKFKQPSNIHQALNLMEFLDSINERFNEKEFIDGFSMILTRFLNDPEYYSNYQDYMNKLKQLIDLLKKYSPNDKLVMKVDETIKGSE